VPANAPGGNYTIRLEYYEMRDAHTNEDAKTITRIGHDKKKPLDQ
jgi:hypothetical protein